MCNSTFSGKQHKKDLENGRREIFFLIFQALIMESNTSTPNTLFPFDFVTPVMFPWPQLVGRGNWVNPERAVNR